jgi:hypothetical protein
MPQCGVCTIQGNRNMIIVITVVTDSAHRVCDVSQFKHANWHSLFPEFFFVFPIAVCVGYGAI